MVLELQNTNLKTARAFFIRSPFSTIGALPTAVCQLLYKPLAAPGFIFDPISEN